MTAWSDYAVVAVVARPQGRRGEVIAATQTDFGTERFKPGNVVYATRKGALEPEALTITSSREHDGRWVLGFAGFESIEDAETLRGLELKIKPEDLTALSDGMYYVHDLVGCAVQAVDGSTVGVVTRVEFGGAAALVVNDGRGEVMVPMVETICRKIDIAAKTVVIEPPEGLLELRVTTNN